MAPAATPTSPSSSPKRPLEADQHACDAHAKRRKTQTQHDSDSAASNLSGASALMPTSVPDDTTEASEIDAESSSDVSDSSEEPSDESSDEDASSAEEDEEEEDAQQDNQQAVINLRANRGTKPEFKLPDDAGLEDIRPFLKGFLPKLKAANEELEAQRKAGTLVSSEITVADEEGQYIEMNLGLGVLEEKDGDANSGAPEPSDSENGEDREGQQRKEKDILGKLMGRSKAAEPVGIQEVTDAQGNT